MDNPLIKQQEESNKIADLTTLIKSNPDPRELKRALAIKMSIERQPDLVVQKSILSKGKKIRQPEKTQFACLTFYAFCEKQK